MDQILYRYWLANLHNIGIKKIERLIDVFGSAESVYKATEGELYALKRDGAFAEIMSTRDIDTILCNRDMDIVAKNYEKLLGNGIRFVTSEEEAYPDRLRNIFAAPYALYVKGRLPDKEDKLLAVVGARECTHYGMEMANYLTSEIAKEGIHIISGLARGIDTYAHRGALTSGGITYAVMGCGIDICYPQENINYYMDIQREGGVISEYAPKIQPIAGNFPMRNRIISGLSDGILVIEAKEKSGSLITVDYGLEQGKEIYALPGRATDRLSLGCNNLIRMGAKLITSPKDILEDFIPGYFSKDNTPNNNGRKDAKQHIIYSCLDSDPKHYEEIALLTGVPMEFLPEQLLQLELQGLIRQTQKNYYCRN
jgi:DNA processing protein